MEKITRSQKPKLPPVKVVSAVNRIRSHVSQIHTKMVPPPVALLELISGMWVARAVAAAAELGVADALAGGPRDYHAVAAKVKAHPEALYRLMRALTVSGIFVEREKGIFELTALGECLRTDHPTSMRHMAMLQGGFNWSNWEELTYCVRTGKSAVEKVRGKPMFEALGNDKEAWSTFDRAMTNISAMEVDAVLAAYSFEPFATIADVGGGHGAFLSAILSAHPKSRGILFDLPEVVEGGKVALEKAGLGNRCRFLGGSFFKEAPEGADAYVMKHIIHDWSDEEALKILKHVRGRMKAGMLILVESVIPKPNEKHFSKYLDLEMLVVTTGKERTREQWAELLSHAGFKLQRIVPTISMASVLEAVPG